MSRIGPIVVAIGPFPPPIHGQSMATARLCARLSERLPVLEVNVTPETAAFRRTIQGVWQRALAYGRAVFTLIAARMRGSISGYLVFDAGWGAPISFLMVAVSRLLTPRVFVHHHTYWSVRRPSQWMRLMFALTRRLCTHIVLSNTMANRFVAAFGPDLKTRVIDNALVADFPRVQGRKTVSPRFVVGFYSNLTEGKGISDFLDRVEAHGSNDPSLEFWIAGARYDDALSARLDATIQRCGDRLRYFGQVSGEAKAAFLHGLSLLMHPSRDEARPICIIEALAFGVDIISLDVGDLAEMIGPENVFPDLAALNQALEARLAERSPTILRQRRSQARARYDAMIKAGEDDLEQVFALLCAPPAPRRELALARSGAAIGADG